VQIFATNGSGWKSHELIIIGDDMGPYGYDVETK
jgi:hypothetical protein